MENLRESCKANKPINRIVAQRQAFESAVLHLAFDLREGNQVEITQKCRLSGKHV